MAARRGSLRLPLLPTTPKYASGLLRPVGLLPRRGSKRSSSMKGAGRRTGGGVPGVSPGAEAYLAVEEVQQKNKGSDGGAALFGLVTDAARAVLRVLKAMATGRRRSWAPEAENIAIINCRFFTLIGVARTLMGSVLCFVEGCSLVVEAYLEYFHALWEKLDNQGEAISLLIEAIDMFLVGSAMLNFGMGLYTMFVGSRGSKRYISRLLPRVAISLHQKILPSSMPRQCISEAKAKFGHAVLTLLQAGVVEKVKGVPLSGSLDLACFAGAILVSSAGVFLLARLHTNLQGSLEKEEGLEVS